MQRLGPQIPVCQKVSHSFTVFAVSAFSDFFYKEDLKEEMKLKQTEQNKRIAEIVKQVLMDQKIFGRKDL